MTPDETAATLQSLTRAAARLAELEARVAHHAETVDVAATTGASSTANWWAHQTKQTRPEARRKTRLAAALACGDHDPVRDAMATGDLLVDQAHAVIDAVTALPDGLDPDMVKAAETYLVSEGRHHDARTLRTLGRHTTHPGRRRPRQDPRTLHHPHRPGRDPEEDAPRPGGSEAPHRHRGSRHHRRTQADR